MAKRKIHSKRKITVPLAVVAGFMPMAFDAWNTRESQGGLAKSIPHSVAGALIGYDTVGKKFTMANWTQAGGPAIWAGFGVHYAAQKLGLNRMIARAGIPFVRI